MSTEIIHQRMLKNTSDNFDKSRGSWTYDVEAAAAVEINHLKGDVDSLLDKINVDKLTGDELTRFVYQRAGVERREATFASDEVLIKTTAPTRVNVGDLVAADDVFYEIIENVNLPSTGEHYVKARCTQSGVFGNVPAGAINSFPVTLDNISGVTNDVAFTNGYEQESDESLRNRYYDKLQKPGMAGNVYHYEEWAKSVIGVGKVKVYPLWDGPLTVKVIVVDANDELPPEDLLNNVYEYIESERPFGATVTVTGPNVMVIDINVDVTIAPTSSVEGVKAELEMKLDEYIKSLIFNAEYVSLAQIGRIILEVDGIVDYSVLTINGDIQNVTIPDETITVLGEVLLV